MARARLEELRRAATAPLPISREPPFDHQSRTEGGSITTARYSWSSVATASACETQCQGDAPRCLGWRHGADRVCALYEHDGRGPSDQARQTIRKAPVQNEPAQKATGAAAEGGRITSARYSWSSLATASACETQCRGDAPRCKGWRFDHANVCFLYEKDSP